MTNIILSIVAILVFTFILAFITASMNKYKYEYQSISNMWACILFIVCLQISILVMVLELIVIEIK